MKRKARKLAEVELQIMNGIWRHKKPITVRELHQKLFSNGEKAYTTVQTIMNILVDKGFLRKDKIGMVNFYFPVVTQSEYAKLETNNFVSRIFRGSFGELATYLVDSGELTDDDLARIKAMITEKENQKRGKS